MRNGTGGRRREIGMDARGWEQLGPWLAARLEPGARARAVRRRRSRARSDGHDTSPGLALAQLETLLGRAWAGGGTVALGVEGPPRVLPVANNMTLVLDCLFGPRSDGCAT